MRLTRYISFITVGLIGLLLAASQPLKAAGITVQNLRCELLKNPEGIDALQPRLSWELTSTARNTNQTAYQILVASSADKLAANVGDLWNSGWVGSNQSTQITYKGKPLQSTQACFWKVKVWTNKTNTDWSSPAHWSMGLLKLSDWKGKWIGLDKAFPWDSVSKFSRLSARYFRKEFAAKPVLKRATAYVAGLGLYHLYLNGYLVGNDGLTPSPTDYTKAVKYNTYDVSSVIKNGANTIGAVLGNGRYFTMRQNYKPLKIKTFGYPKMLLQLKLEYADGSVEWVNTDDTWKVTADGPIRSNNEYDGEEYDATKELTGWVNTGFNDAQWLKPDLVSAPGGQLEAQMNEQVKVTHIVKPISIKPLGPGVFVLDMGQNMAGWLQIKVKGNKGDKVTLNFAETLKPDGDLYTANLRDAKVTDVYTLKGEGTETWHPAFVYHGFKYVKISGLEGTPALNDFEGQVVNDDLDTVGSFATSDSLVNHIYRNACWGIIANYKGMPLDCPQRNERMPWLADHATGSYSESFVYDNSRFYAKWLDDIEEAQKPDGAIPDVAPAFWNYYSDNMSWPGTYLIVADMLYNQYADDKPIAKHYASMKKWLDYMKAKYMADGIVTKDKYGDWCVPPESAKLIHSADTLRSTDGHLIATAYYFRMLTLMKHFATILGKQQDIKEFDALSAQINLAFNKEFFNARDARYANNSVTSNLLPLYFGMVPADKRQAVFKNIVDKIVISNNEHISTGVVGTQWLMRSLTDNGRTDIAWKLATNTTYPSWGYMVNRGATTFWELWNGDTASPQMNSQNHVMLLGDLLVWLYEDLAGIKSSAQYAGFQQLVMSPQPVDGLNFVNASYHSAHGLIKSNWKKQNGHFIWNISIPANNKAMIAIPSSKTSSVTEGGKAANTAEGVKFIKLEAGKSIYEVSSGDYSFDCEL